MYKNERINILLAERFYSHLYNVVISECIKSGLNIRKSWAHAETANNSKLCRDHKTITFVTIVRNLVKTYIVNVQRDATISSLYFILLHDHSTCFGCLSHSSSGVRETVVTATGTSHISR